MYTYHSGSPGRVLGRLRLPDCQPPRHPHPVRLGPGPSVHGAVHPHSAGAHLGVPRPNRPRQVQCRRAAVGGKQPTQFQRFRARCHAHQPLQPACLAVGDRHSAQMGRYVDKVQLLGVARRGDRRRGTQGCVRQHVPRRPRGAAHTARAVSFYYTFYVV